MANEDEQSQLLTTAMKVIDGYNKWEVEAIFEPRAKDCEQKLLPESLNRSSSNNEQYRQALANFMPRFEKFRMEVLDVVEDPKRHKVLMHVKSSAESVVGTYANEYMILMTMTEDDQKVVFIKEFVDSQYTNDFFKRLADSDASA